MKATVPPSLLVSADGRGVVSHAGSRLLADLADRSTLTGELSGALGHLARPRAVHDPGRVLVDLAVAVADGGECISDVAVLADQPGLFGAVASDSTVWRLRLCCVRRARAVTVALAEEAGRARRPRAARPNVQRSAFAGFRFPPEVITVAVRRYLRYGLSYRDVEELLAERVIEVDHVTVYRWVQRFTPLFTDAARPRRHATGDRWFVDETYVKVAGQWRYLYRAVDQYGQVIDVLLSEHRDTAAARRFFTRALRHGPAPLEVTTDKAGPYLRVLDDLVPAAAHVTEQFANNRVEADHCRLKARLRPMRGLKQLRSAARIAAGHALVQNLRRGHYELTADVSPPLRLATAFSELALAM